MRIQYQSHSEDTGYVLLSLKLLRTWHGRPVNTPMGCWFESLNLSRTWRGRAVNTPMGCLVRISNVVENLAWTCCKHAHGLLVGIKCYTKNDIGPPVLKV